MAYDPDYIPVGVNNRSNAYYKKINHVRLAKNQSNRQTFFAAGSVPAPTESGPYVTPGGINYWLRAIYENGKPQPGTWDVGFDVTPPFDPDLWLTLLDFLANPSISQQAKRAVLRKTEELES